MKHSLLSILVFLISVIVLGQSQQLLLLPQPQSITWFESVSSFKTVTLLGQNNDVPIDKWLHDLDCALVEEGAIHLQLNFVDNIEEASVNPEEAYRLSIKNKLISIEAQGELGAYRAFQTMRQLIFEDNGESHIHNCEIVDWPAFKIRGFMHDVGRGFIPLSELKKQIALLAQFKINVFHWHLTEDIGWRLESKIFPQLTENSNFERLHGKYYTIDEAKELVEFCKEHQVLLIPEIDIPGHSAAFTRALGYDMQSEQGMRLLKQLMDEICNVFVDVPYIHIGTDEVRFTNPNFVPEMVNYIRKKGKKVISWNPGWKYKTGEIDMIQMWSSRGKLHPGIPAIDSRLHYINHFDTFADIVGLYHSNVAEVSEGNNDVAGAIIAAWNDRYIDSVKQIIAENGFYPSMLTLAESTWKGGREKYFYKQGVQIGEPGSNEYESFKEFENRLLYYKDHLFANEPFTYVRQTNVKWRITDPFPNKGRLNKSFQPEEVLKEQYDYKGQVYKTYETIGAGIYLRHVWGELIPSFYENPKPNHTAYAFTWVYSPHKQKVGLYVRFQNYGRSESDLPPPQGKWDYKESRIWLNDIEVMPPIWQNNHQERTPEISLRNENWEGRAPQTITLEEGWNKVLLKLPVGKFNSKEVRLVKWMFNAVFVSPDGRHALENIVYSPDKSL